MLGDVGLRNFLVITCVPKHWIVELIVAWRFATTGRARRAEFGVCIGVNVGTKKRRGNVVIG